MQTVTVPPPESLSRLKTPRRAGLSALFTRRVRQCSGSLAGRQQGLRKPFLLAGLHPWAAGSSKEQPGPHSSPAIPPPWEHGSLGLTPPRPDQQIVLVSLRLQDLWQVMVSYMLWDGGGTKRQDYSRKPLTLPVLNILQISINCCRYISKINSLSHENTRSYCKESRFRND